jgi:uncharacterized protein YkwD
MKKIIHFLTFLCSLFSLSAFAQTEEKGLAEETLRLINEYRQSKSLAPLLSEAVIYEQCLAHSKDMAQDDALNHDGFDRRAKNIGKSLKITAWAENVAFNFGEDNPAKTAFLQWKNSRGHHKNVVGKSYTHTGLAVVKTSEGKYYFTQIFVRLVK